MNRKLPIVAIIALLGCNPFHERRLPIADSVKGLEGIEPHEVRYCPCDGGREPEKLPLQLWPEIKTQLLALKPDPEVVSGPWNLRGRLIITFPDASDLYIDFNTWNERFGDRVFVIVYWLPEKGHYQVGKGRNFFAWYRSATTAGQRHSAGPNSTLESTPAQRLMRALTFHAWAEASQLAPLGSAG